MIPTGPESARSTLADPERAYERLEFDSTIASSPKSQSLHFISLLIIGASLLLASIALFAGSTYTGNDEGMASGALLTFGIIAFGAGLIYLAIADIAKRQMIESAHVSEFKTEPRDFDFDINPGGSHYHEVVKVRCRYCRTLNDVVASSCVACGAQL